MSAGLDGAGLAAAFPFHLLVDRRLRLVEAGPALRDHDPALEPGVDLRGRLSVVSPETDASFEALRAQVGNPMLLRIDPSGLVLRGQLIECGPDRLLYVGSPWVTEPEELRRLGLTIRSFAVHDPTPEFLFLRQAQGSAVSDARELLQKLEVEMSERVRLEQTERALEHEMNASVDFWMRLDRAGTVLELRISPTLRVFSEQSEQLIGQPLPPSLGGISSALESLGDTLSPKRTHRFECTIEAGRPLHFDCRATATLGGDVLVVGRDVTDRFRLEEQLRHQALHDALTGLPNRTLLQERLGRALRTMRTRPDGKDLALLFIDLDDFKTINDVLGHSVGDGLLVQVAQRLQANLRPNDTAARLGGDEFAVILEGLSHAGHALEVAHRLRTHVTERISLQGTEVRPLCSVGIAVTQGGESAEELFRQADLAMYRAKESGSGVDLFDDVLREKVTERLERKRELEPALAEDQFVLHYQPIVDLEDFRLVGVEALVRWQHPELGLLGPVSFIDLAEESGLIVALGRRILEMACGQVASWRAAGGCGSALRLSVNLSAKQLAHPDLVGDVAAILDRSGLDAGALTLEITESHVVDDVEHATRVLERLRETGARIAMDDFGQGYSALSYLERLPIDLLKVDKAFVDRLANPEPAVLTEIVFELGHRMGLEIVAEGIEQAEQVNALHDLACRLGQGYLFSPPVPADEIGRWLNAGGPPFADGCGAKDGPGT